MGRCLVRGCCRRSSNTPSGGIRNGRWQSASARRSVMKHRLCAMPSSRPSASTARTSHALRRPSCWMIWRAPAWVCASATQPSAERSMPTSATKPWLPRSAGTTPASTRPLVYQGVGALLLPRSSTYVFVGSTPSRRGIASASSPSSPTASATTSW